MVLFSLLLLFNIVVVVVHCVEFQSLTANEFVRVTITDPKTPHIVTFTPSQVDTNNTPINFKIYKCFGQFDSYIRAGKGKEPSPVLNQGSAIDKSPSSQSESKIGGVGPGTTAFNVATFATGEFSGDKQAIYDIVAYTNEASLEAKIPKLPEDTKVTIVSKKDRTNVISWKATLNNQDTYSVYLSDVFLPTTPYDGRFVGTACGVEESGMMLVKGGMVPENVGATMTLTIEGIMGVQTAVVVVSRANGYKNVYFPADLSVEGGVETVPERDVPAGPGTQETLAPGEETSSTPTNVAQLSLLFVLSMMIW